MIRRVVSIIALVAGTLLLGAGTWLGWPWWMNMVVLTALSSFALLEWYEKFAIDAKRLALVATLSAMGAVGRAAVQGIPGVQPATFLVIVSGYSFGPAVGAVVGALTGVASDLFLGEGGWTPWHMAAWGLAGLTAGLLRMVLRKYRTVILTLFGILWGYLFGWIMNTWLWFGGTLSVHSYLVLCVSSFWFDTLHAAATGGLLFFAGKAVFAMLERYRKRMIVQKGENSPMERGFIIEEHD